LIILLGWQDFAADNVRQNVNSHHDVGWLTSAAVGVDRLHLGGRQRWRWQNVGVVMSSDWRMIYRHLRRLAVEIIA